MKDHQHIPVLLRSVRKLLVTENPSKVLVDCTLGAGGHFKKLLNCGLGSHLSVGIDCDRSALEIAKRTLEGHIDPPPLDISIRRIGTAMDSTPSDSTTLQTGGRKICLYHSSFTSILEIMEDTGLPNKGRGQVDTMLFDLGVSSMQLDQPERGFSFRRKGPLDMRMDSIFHVDKKNITAGEMIDSLDEKKLEDILAYYGQEPMAIPLSKKIIEMRRAGKLQSTLDLKKCVDDVYSDCGIVHSKPIDNATRTFQAIRIAVNNELEKFEETLEKIPLIMKPGGRLGILAFHSLETALVSKYFYNWNSAMIASTITKKPWVANKEQVLRNPRSRSAKLFVCEFH